MSLVDEAGRPAEVGQSKGRWLCLEDFISSDGAAIREDDLRCLGFPRDWPAIYSTSPALKALIGKRGSIAAKRVAVAGEPLPEDRVSSITCQPLQSFTNAAKAARSVPGLVVVQGWAVFERLDRAPGTVFVAERYCWNSSADGRWVDLTPRPETISQLLLAEGECSRKPQQSSVLSASEASLGRLLLECRFPSLAAVASSKLPGKGARSSEHQQKEVPQKRQEANGKAASKEANGKAAPKVLDYSKWSKIVDSDDEEDIPRAPLPQEDCGVRDLAEGREAKKPLPVPDFLVGSTGGGGGTNCFTSLTKLLDAEQDKGDTEHAHQLAQVFGKIFHQGISDTRRQAFYRKSLAAVPADAFVILLGLGSIIPLLHAARRGPGKGALLETSAKLAKVAESIIQANKLKFPVAVVKPSFDDEVLMTDALKQLVPKDAKNVVVLTERMAHDLLSNGIVPSCVMAHKAVRSCAPNAKITHIPKTVELTLAPVEIRSESLKEFDIRPFNAFRHTTSNDKADFWWWPVRLENQRNTRAAVLGPSKVLCGFDFDRSPEITLDEVRRTLKLEATVRGRCNGAALWWTAKFGDEEYSSRPSMAEAKTPKVDDISGKSEWKQAVHYLAGETALFPGDTLELLVSVTPRFTVRMLQQSPFSVEAPAWVQAPLSSKFAATMPVLPYHFLMLTDHERLEVYQRALSAAVQAQRKKLGRRPRVLDAGCGIGLLGMTAALEGAEVWLCEAVPLMRRMCREVVAANAAAVTEKQGLVQLLPPMMSTRIQIGEDVQEKFDIVVSEVMDLWCLGEGIIPTMRHAHKKLLASGGLMLPGKLMIFVQPLELKLWSKAEREHGVDLQALQTGMKSKFSPLRINQFPRRWLTEEPIAALEIDLAHVPAQPGDGEPNLEGGVKLCIRMGGKPALRAKISSATIDHSGILSGYGIWWAADLGEGNVVTSHPDNPQRSWKQLVRWLDHPRYVEHGEEIQVLTCYNDHQVNVEDIYVPQGMVDEYQQALAKQQQRSHQQGAPTCGTKPEASPAQAASAPLEEPLLEVD
eukprot:TRINITY_DN93256_c0_g1_i1.p1 TRINITY_DN93256_c0_g1~~TRINITY_DN93256_c0_g1_i1.p1  ORF type:complete len:1039 (+),score=249.52 TRINITY_DN93256_c0_g1_i1:35-3151(+)